MKPHQKSMPEEIREIVADRRQEIAAETKDARGRRGLFNDRIKRLGGRLYGLQTNLEERKASGERFDASVVVEQIRELSRSLEDFTRAKEQSEDRLNLLETRAASLVAGFDQEYPERQ